MGRLKKDQLVNITKTAEEYRKAAEGHQKAVKNIQKTFVKTGIFAFAAICVIIFMTVAWFFNNSKVSAKGINISANSAEKYVIASAGLRQIAEEKKYIENGKNILFDSDGVKYFRYYDTLTGETKENELILYQGSAWHLQDNGTMYPGSRGVLEFYVIPLVEGLKEIPLTLDEVGYKLTGDTDNPVVRIEDNDVINELLKGHILFFKNLDDIDGYSGWIGADKREISVKANENEVLQKDLPYKVSIYWIWPKRYRNFIYHQKSTEGDLFASDSEDYEKLIEFINQNKTKFFYEYNNDEYDITTGITMTDEMYTRGVSYYNQADEHIGNNVDYIYLEIKP